MAIFTAVEHGSAIQRCLLNGRDVTRLATCASIPGPILVDVPPPVGVVMEAVDGNRANIIYRCNENGANGVLIESGWVDILDTTDEGYPCFIIGDNNEPTMTRYYGVVELEWVS